MQKVLFESFLLASGGLIFLFSLSFDILYQGSPGIGFSQFVGMAIGLINILIGLRYILLPQQSKWDWLLLAIYICGIFIVGLRPTESFDIDQNLLLSFNSFNKRDFLLNLAGFIPLGFLILSLVKQNSSDNKIFWLVAITASIGFFTSLMIEALQYFWIPGRFSSAYDLTANTFGTIIGAVCYGFLRDRRFITQKI